MVRYGLLWAQVCRVEQILLMNGTCRVVWPNLKCFSFEDQGPQTMFGYCWTILHMAWALLHFWCLGAQLNHRHLFSNERCAFELNPPPPPPWSKCLWKNADQEMKVWSTCDTNRKCLDLRSNSGKACGVPGSTEGLFSCLFLCRAGLASRLPSAIRSAHHWQRRRESTLQNASTNSQ